MLFIDRLRAESVPASDAVERLIVDAKGDLSHIAERLEAQWALFEPIAGPGFVKKFRRSPHEQWWEMYLGSELVRAKLDVARPPFPDGRGPDFVIAHACGTICIEAVCPGRGDVGNPDSVPLLVPGEAAFSPNEEMALRIRRSIVEDKSPTFRRYIDARVIPSDSRNIVAVSCSQLDHFPDLDVMAGSVLPIGPLMLQVGSDGGESEAFFACQTKIVRRSGAAKSKTAFVDGKAPHISGAIFYGGSLFNSSQPPCTLHLVHNQTAAHPLPTGILPFVQEWGSPRI